MPGLPTVIVLVAEHPVEEAPAAAAERLLDADEGRIQIFARIAVVLFAAEEAEKPEVALVRIFPNDDGAHPELPPIFVAELFVPRSQAAERPVFEEIDFGAEALGQEPAPRRKILFFFRQGQGDLQFFPAFRDSLFPVLQRFT